MVCGLGSCLAYDGLAAISEHVAVSGSLVQSGGMMNFPITFTANAISPVSQKHLSTVRTLHPQQIAFTANGDALLVVQISVFFFTLTLTVLVTTTDALQHFETG